MYLLPGFVFLLGLAGGSFLGLCIFRLPRGESIVYPPSRCDACERRLGLLELIPVLGYIRHRGRCLSCGSPVLWWYPALEIMTGVLYLGLWYRFGPGWLLVKYVLLVSLLVVVAGIDLKTYTIPDGLVFLGLGLGLLFLPLGEVSWQDAFLGALLGGGLLLLLAVISRGGMGGGDVKLCFVLGLFMGWQHMLLTLFAAVLTGAAVGLMLMVSGRKGRRDVLPFAPFLAGGVLVALWRGAEFVEWYLTSFFKF